MPTVTILLMPLTATVAMAVALVVLVHRRTVRGAFQVVLAGRRWVATAALVRLERNVRSQLAGGGSYRWSDPWIALASADRWNPGGVVGRAGASMPGAAGSLREHPTVEPDRAGDGGPPPRPDGGSDPAEHLARLRSAHAVEPPEPARGIGESQAPAPP